MKNPSGLRTTSHARKRWLLGWIVISILTCPTPLTAQFTENYQTNTVSSVVIEWTGDYVVGSNTVFDHLQIINGGALSNAYAYVGYQAGATNNSALVDGTNSLWQSFSGLNVGYSGSGNQVNLQNGGQALSGWGNVGCNGVSSNNQITVSGSGSSWQSTGAVSVGRYGSRSQLVITNGGSVHAAAGVVGAETNSNHNLALVIGGNSIWNCSSDLYVGEFGSGNQVNVVAGGAVHNDNARLGYGLTSADNQVVVDGTNSIWQSLSGLNVGVDGSGNQVELQNGGQALSGWCNVGYSSSSSNNYVTVTGPGSSWHNTNNVAIGVNGSGNRLTITNGGAVDNSRGYVGDSTNSDNNLVLVTGGNSVWTCSSNLYLGMHGDNNHLVITNGGKVLCSDGYFAGWDESSNNVALVVGADSRWTCSDTLWVGWAGPANQLMVSDGGTLLTAAAELGYGPNSTGNSVVVNGIGSSWSNAFSISLGVYGDENQLVVTNGGEVCSGSGMLGGSSESRLNTVIVSGERSTWRNDRLYVGDYGVSNRLLVLDKGTVFSSWATFGHSESASNNLAVVSDPGSTWAIAQDLELGYLAGQNALIVSNGGGVVCGRSGSVGAFNGSNCLAMITDPGSSWTNLSSLYIGNSGNFGNLLVISNGAVVYAPSIWMSGPSNNLVLAGGSLLGTALRVTDRSNSISGYGTIDCAILNYGVLDANRSGQTLALMQGVQNRGLLRARNGGTIEFFGPLVNFGSTNFTGGTAFFHAPVYGGGPTNIWISGGDGAWQAGGNWSLGTPSPAHSALLVTNANSKVVTVDASTASAAPNSLTNVSVYVGAPNGTTNTLRVVDLGEGPVFLAVDLAVGTGGRLEVTNSTVALGLAGAGTLTIAGEVEVRGGKIIGDGPTVSVGTSNHAGQVFIRDSGAVVFNPVPGLSGQETWIGGTWFNSSSGNKVIVDGSGSVWKNVRLRIGYYSQGNELEVINGGRVHTSNTTWLGSTNSVLVSGLGSVWSNGLSLTFQYSSAQLVISNGGAVFGNTNLIGANGSNNCVMVTGAGSALFDAGTLNVGNGYLYQFSNNRLIVTNGARVCSRDGYVGASVGSNNLAIVTGPGSVWSNTAGLYVGYRSINNQLQVTDAGSVIASDAFVGWPWPYWPSTNNSVLMAGGHLVVTNSFNDGTLNVSGGSVLLDGGTVTLDALLLTNGTQSVFTFNSGTVSAKNSAVTNGVPFVIGNGVQAALYRLDGGVHSFADALCISSNASLLGCATVNGSMLVKKGGSVVANCGGALVFTGIITNNGVMRAEASSVVEFYGLVVNNGIMDFTAGAGNFHSIVINNGTMLCPPVVINADPSAPSEGTVSGSGTYACGTNVTVCAFPIPCFRFVDWEEGSNVVSTSACYSFAATGNRNLVASFSRIVNTIGTSSSPPSGGTTGGDGGYACGTNVTVCATPNSGHGFLNWTAAGNVVSTSPCYTFAVTNDRALVAHFGVPPTITSVSPLPDGTVGIAYSFGLQATNGTAPYQWSVVAGQLPSGLSLSTNGELAGTPSGATPANFTLQVMGAEGYFSAKAFSLMITPLPTSPIYRWTTIAGSSGNSGSANGTNSAARFNNPRDLALGDNEEIYIADSDNNTIRKLTPIGTNWEVSTIAGSAGSAGSADGTNNTARFRNPRGLVMDAEGGFFVTDCNNHTIRKVTPLGTNWVVTTIAGSAGNPGSANGTNAAARFNNPEGIAMDDSGNLYVPDSDNHTIRKLAPVGPDWVASTIAGSAGSAGVVDGTNNAARFNGPRAISRSPGGGFYVTEANGNTVRSLAPEGTNWVVTTIAGLAGITGSADGTNTAARFNSPRGVGADAMHCIYIASRDNHTIRRIMPLGTNWVVSTIGGHAGSTGNADGTNDVARFNTPTGVAVESERVVYVANCNSHTIRKGTLLSPVVFGDPQNSEVLVDHPICFGITVSGEGPIFYQWQKDSTNLVNGSGVSGATSNLLCLSTTVLEDGGSYRVVITNTYGSVTSSVAALTVCMSPSLLSHPARLTVAEGNPASFSVSASGTLPLTYRWLRNGTGLVNAGNITGADSANITLNTTTIADAGIYCAVVTNNYGSVTSAFATLTVIRTSAPPGSSWIYKSPMSGPRSGACAVELNGLIYVIGGGNETSVVNTLEVYNPATDSWTTKAPMPTARANAAAGVINGRIYVAGGYTGSGFSDSLEVYHPTSNIWTTSASMLARVEAPGAALGNTLYALGGNYSGLVRPYVQAYDATTNGWRSVASMPTGRMSEGVAVAQGRIYTIGGNQHTGTPVGTVEVYDPVSNTWTNAPTMPTSRRNLAAATMNDSIFAVGGNNYSNGAYRAVSTVEIYDPNTCLWTPGPDMLTNRIDAAVCVAGDRLFAIGGVASATTGGNLASVEALTVPPTRPAFAKVVCTNGVLVLAWSAVPGRVYQIVYSTNFTQSAWLPLADPMPAYSDTLSASDLVGSARNSFYRVVMLP